MWTRPIAAVVWMLVAASALAWGWRFQREPAGLPAPAQAERADDANPSDPAQLLRLLGAQGASSSAPLETASAAARYQLQGVIAGSKGKSGVALIAIDGKPARAYQVGARVGDELLLQSLDTRSARLAGQSGVLVFSIELPALPPPAVSRAPVPADALALVAAPATAVLAVPSAAAVSAPVPVPVSSVRTAAPGEMVEPGRRLRLQAHRADGAPPLK